MRFAREKSACCTIVGLLLWSASARAETVELPPTKDTVIFSITQNNSNGAGTRLFCGRSGPFGANGPKRCLISFDIAGAIPAGSIIQDVHMTLTLMQASSSNSGSYEFTLRRLTRDWGEGDSDSGAFTGLGAPATPGDATWKVAFFPSDQWTNTGGDFVALVSAAETIGHVSADNDGARPVAYTWGPTGQLRDDAQDMLDNPAANFGWILRGTESVDWSSRKFASREEPDTTLRPRLTIEYTPPACVADLNADMIVDAEDLALLLGNWGPCGLGPLCIGDMDGDGDVDATDLAVLLGAWGPC